jgi:RNA polymerase sigma-70 factor (ECF subfamily)
LLSRYQDRLFGVCMRMVNDRDLAADLTQDAMIKVIEGLGSFDARAKLSTWMIRVTMNVCLSRLRAERVRRHVSLDSTERGPTGSGPGGRSEAWSHEAGEPEPTDRVERDETRRRVSAALLRVAPEQRAILVLRDCRGLDYEQIADVLAVPVGTVKSRLFRARAALREVLEQDGRMPTAGRRAPDSAV